MGPRDHVKWGNQWNIPTFSSILMVPHRLLEGRNTIIVWNKDVYFFFSCFFFFYFLMSIVFLLLKYPETIFSISDKFGFSHLKEKFNYLCVRPCFCLAWSGQGSVVKGYVTHSHHKHQSCLAVSKSNSDESCRVVSLCCLIDSQPHSLMKQMRVLGD